MSDELDPHWHSISRFQPGAIDFAVLLTLLEHEDWQVRFNAARVLRFEPDARALDRLIALFEREKHAAVRHMAALALGALHESGVPVPQFSAAISPTAETRRDLAIRRLKELKVGVSAAHTDCVQLMIPHTLTAESFIEIGYLMAQLVDDPFPDHYGPIAEGCPSAVLPTWSSPIVDYVENYPHGMKFRVYRRRD